MIYNNPVIKGFYPDPSVCKVDNMYYLVCSSFQYFPGVSLFESEDLVNWKQIGHCLTRKSQVQLDHVNSSGGIFAPTIRYNNGRFYMTTTNDTTHQNFYVWTEDIYGEWSEPINVAQGGIDPSLFFEDGKTYFMSNGADDVGVEGIVQCEIDIETGRKLAPSRTIWQGSGGRFLEGPHLYKIDGAGTGATGASRPGYYLIAAEGGTEFGHMITYARGDSPYGPFEAYPHNPVLTNRNLGGFEIQGVGHGDLIQDNSGNWWILHLGFRQIGQWTPYHHLGREVFLTPVTFGKDGWFTAGHNGTTIKCFDTHRIHNARARDGVVQSEKKYYTFENTEWDKDWCYLRLPHTEDYLFEKNKLKLKGTEVTLDKADSPTFIGLRQKDFNAVISCDVCISEGEAGITLYMDENHHYDLAIRKCGNSGPTDASPTGFCPTGKIPSYEVIERLNVGDVKSVEKAIDLKNANTASLIIRADNYRYSFCIEIDGKEMGLGAAQTKYLSSEVAGGFTGVIIGLYACARDGERDCNYAEFTNFSLQYL